MHTIPPVKSLIDIATEAGNIIMQYYQGSVAVQIKDDNSPVTAADIAANDYIMAQLAFLTPDIPIVSEENDAGYNEQARQAGRFWLVDPLDGTKGFIKKTGEFTVNIALVDKAQPIAGVVYVPAQEMLYYTGDDGKAYKQEKKREPQLITVRSLPEDGAVVVASRSHNTPETDAFIHSIKVKEIVSAASSVKLCLVAEGKADIYPRFGTTMEWDIAAGHAVLAAAGGIIKTTEGKPFLYGKQGLQNSHFIAEGRGASS